MSNEKKYRYNPNKLAYEEIKNNNLFNKYFKVLITILGIIGTVITIYAFYFYEKKVNLEYQIMSEINVLDLKEDLGKLDILYDSTSLKKTRSNLKIFTIKVVNSGNERILIEYFDEREPLGIKVNSGRIVEKPELIDSSSKYLEKHLAIKLIDESKFDFNKLIFEPNEYFTIKFLVLHNRDELPKLTSQGKIAGQKKIVFNDNLSNEEFRKSFFERLFEGSLLIYIIRAFGFLLFWILVLGIVTEIGLKLKALKYNSDKRKKIKDFKNSNEFVDNSLYESIFNRFLNEGQSFMSNYITVANLENSELQNFYQKYLKMDDTFEKPKYSKDHYDQDSYILNSIKSMINDGYLVEIDNRIIVNTKLIDILSKFYFFTNSSIFNNVNHG